MNSKDLFMVQQAQTQLIVKDKDSQLNFDKNSKYFGALFSRLIMKEMN